MSLKNRLIGAGIVLSAVGYIGYLAASHVVNSVKDEAEKLEKEKEKELRSCEESPEETSDETPENDMPSCEDAEPDPA